MRRGDVANQPTSGASLSSGDKGLRYARAAGRGPARLQPDAPIDQSGPHPFGCGPDWGGRMSGGGWDGEEATRCGTGRSVVPLHDVHDGDGGRDEHGGQDHQEDHEWDQHGFTYISLRGIRLDVL